MFVRSEIQSLLDRDASISHRVTLNSPYSFEVRPAGFKRGEPNYRVVVERSAFALRATVVPDYLAVAVVAAIVAGAKNNPPRVTRLRQSLEMEGWETEIRLSQEGFRLAATKFNAGGLDDDELTSAGTSAALEVSEFVLDQLIVTRTYGEVRPAVERPIGEAGEVDPWLYDPSERDRSTQVHRSLENWLMLKLRELGVEPLDPAGEPFFDLAWRTPVGFMVCEVKSTRLSENHQIRLGLGQVLHYAAMLSHSGIANVKPSLLVEGAPVDPLWLGVCERSGVSLFWPDKWDDVASGLIGGGPQ